MAKMPIQKIAGSAIVSLSALIGAVLVGPAPIAGAGAPGAVSAPVRVAPSHTVDDPDDDPAPLVQDPPEVLGPVSPNQKTLFPTHHRSHHRPPNTH